MKGEDSSRAVTVIGGSHGSFEALEELLPQLPEGCQLKIVIALHQYRHGSDQLEKVLQPYTRIPVLAVNDKDQLEPGRIYLCPANYHVLFEDDGSVSLNTDPPVLFARPSLDLFFESAAQVFRHSLLALLLSGASADGAAGLQKVKAFGGWVGCQAPETARNGVMPRAGCEAVEPDFVGEPQELGKQLAALCS